MYCPLPAVAEDLDELREWLRQERDAERKRRLHLLVLIASGQAPTRQEAAEHLAVHRITIGQWLKRYEQGGLEGLLRLGARGAPAQQRTISAAAYQALQAQLAEPEGSCTRGWGPSSRAPGLDIPKKRRCQRRLPAAPGAGRSRGTGLRWGV